MASISRTFHQTTIKFSLSQTFPLPKEGGRAGSSRDSVFQGLSLVEHGKRYPQPAASPRVSICNTMKCVACNVRSFSKPWLKHCRQIPSDSAQRFLQFTRGKTIQAL